MCMVVAAMGIYTITNPVVEKPFRLKGNILNSTENEIQVFWSENETFDENNSLHLYEEDSNKEIALACLVPAKTKYLRIDFGVSEKKVEIDDLRLEMDGVESFRFSSNQLCTSNQIEGITCENSVITLNTQSGDPYVVYSTAEWNLENVQNERIGNEKRKLKIYACVFVEILLCIMWFIRFGIRKYVYMIKDNIYLIWDLSVNDFKTRFAGAAFGTFWAFFQPIITILLYWFVFQVGFRSGNSGNTEVPYYLWIATGLIPWFFFSEAWSSATNSLIEYSYLVKKVVFNVSIIPLVKILSALFVHTFFVGLLLLFYLFNGVVPTWNWIQILYYSLAMIVLVVALTYMTSAFVLFFRDTAQIIAVLLQIGVWLTPIMWELKVMPESIHWLFRLNPVYYVINGYRNSLIYNQWAWNSVSENIYFWTFTFVIFCIGHSLFEKLKPHFADVL